MTVQRWVFDTGGAYEYTFPRNPDRYGGDTFWRYEMRNNEVDIVGASLPTIQTDGFMGARRTLRFTAITGTMFRTLQDFYLRMQVVENCKDHLYGHYSSFNCFIESFVPAIHPTIGPFPGTGEDTYDLELTLIKMS